MGNSFSFSLNWRDPLSFIVLEWLGIRLNWVIRFDNNCFLILHHEIQFKFNYNRKILFQLQESKKRGKSSHPQNQQLTLPLPLKIQQTLNCDLIVQLSKQKPGNSLQNFQRTCQETVKKLNIWVNNSATFKTDILNKQNQLGFCSIWLE